MVFTGMIYEQEGCKRDLIIRDYRECSIDDREGCIGVGDRWRRSTAKGIDGECIFMKEWTNDFGIKECEKSHC